MLFLRLNIQISILVENMKLNDDESDKALIREPENEDEVIILEEINPGESGELVAAPSQIEVQKIKKRKQPSITNFFVKKHQ